MATSNNFSTSNSFIKYRIVVTELSQDTANNTSEVNVKVDAWRTNTGYTTSGTGTCYANINGTNYSQSISSGQAITHNSHTVLLNKTVTIQHEQDGSKQIYVSAYIRHSQFTSNSQGFTVRLTDIPRQAIIISVPNFNDTENPVLNYSNAAGELVTSLQACISLDADEPLIPYREINKLGSSYTFELTSAERALLLAASPNDNELVVFFMLKTVIEGETYYDSLDATMSIVNSNPVTTGASYEDVNATTVAITGDSSKIIQNYSTLAFKFASIAAQKGATLTSIKATIEGVTFTDSLSGSQVTNYSLNFGSLNSANNTQAQVEITDSRGNKTQLSLNITVLEYRTPTAYIHLYRKDNYYDETYLTVHADYSYLNGGNNVNITYQYKEKGASTYNSPVSIADEVTYTLSLDNSKNFDFKIIITDLIGNSVTYDLVLQIGLPILFVDRLLRSIGIGTIPPEYNMLAVDRRLALLNEDQEIIVNLATVLRVGGVRTGELTFSDNNGTTLLNLGGRSTGGALELKRLNGNNHMILASDILALYNRNNINTVLIATGGGGYNDGYINIFDAQGNLTAEMVGATGVVSGKRIKQTDGLPELFSGTFTSGSIDFSPDYSAFIFIGRPTSNTARVSTIVPKAMLGDTNTRFQVADNDHYISFDVKTGQVSGADKIIVTFGGRDSTGYIEKVYGLL